MALDATKAAACAGVIATKLAAFTATGAPDPTGTAIYTIIVKAIFDSIIANAVVAGTGPALTAGTVPNVIVGTVT